MPSGPGLVRLPSQGVWRVGWATDPIHSQATRPLDLADTEAGNRFDAVAADFEVCYYGTTPAACYAETLAHRRPSAALMKLIQDHEEWKSFMPPGTVEAEWRRKRVLIRVLGRAPEPMIDLHDHRTLAWLNREFRPLLAIAGLDEITIDSITKGDRLITRYISSWLYRLRDADGQPVFSGIRYMSRHGADLECWALFDRTPVDPVEKRTIDQNDPDLKRIADLFGLRLF